MFYFKCFAFLWQFFLFFYSFPEKVYAYLWCSEEFGWTINNSNKTKKRNREIIAKWREKLLRCHFHSARKDRLDVIFALALVGFRSQADFYSTEIYYTFFLAVAWRRWFIASILKANHNNKKLCLRKRKKKIRNPKQQTTTMVNSKRKASIRVGNKP